MTEYKNPWHKANGRNNFGPEFYKTDVKPVEYKGYLIYERITGHVWDVVKDGVCITQLAGANGARTAIEQLAERDLNANIV